MAKAVGFPLLEGTAIERLHLTFSNITFTYPFLVLNKSSLCFMMMPRKQMEGYEVGFISPNSHHLKAGHLVKAHHPLCDLLLMAREEPLWGTSQCVDGVNCLPQLP